MPIRIVCDTKPEGDGLFYAKVDDAALDLEGECVQNRTFTGAVAKAVAFWRAERNQARGQGAK